MNNKSEARQSTLSYQNELYLLSAASIRDKKFNIGKSGWSLGTSSYHKNFLGVHKWALKDNN